MTIAVIDIGTNTTLLLVTSVDSRGGLHLLAHEQRIPRLGRGVDASRLLLPESMERTLSVLREYRALIDAHAPRAIVVCGTSALRDARNSREFAARVHQATGFTLEILSGEEEALWTYRGALSGLGETDSAIVVDIGGGSTEVTWGQRGRFLGKASVDIGAVRLTERFFRNDPPDAGEVRQARAWVQAGLAGTLRGISAISPLIGVAGTATTLALLDQGASEFSPELVINYRLSLQSVKELLERLLRLRRRDILSLSRALDGREDIIAGGTLILEELMKLLGAREVLVSERGVRYGLALREWERHTGRIPPVG